MFNKINIIFEWKHQIRKWKCLNVWTVLEQNMNKYEQPENLEEK